MIKLAATLLIGPTLLAIVSGALSVKAHQPAQMDDTETALPIQIEFWDQNNG